MPEQVTRRWSDYRRGAKSASISFDVTGVTNGTEAYNKCPFQFNSQHDENPQFKCDDWDVSEPGWQLYRVSFSFSQPEDGDEHNEGESGENPLNSPPRIKWELGNTTEPVDRDADGFAICASDGDVFDPPVTRQMGTVFLTITRFEVAPFDVARALAYQNRVNDSAMTVQGMAVAAGQIFCHSITPTTEYTESAKHVEVAYNFELREDGFKARVLDQGLRGWIGDAAGAGGTPTASEIFDATGVQISAPVRLNGLGKPIDQFLTGKGRKRLIENDQAPNADLESTSDGLVKFLKFDLYKTADFTALGL